MRSVRTTYGTDRIVPGEADLVASTIEAWRGQERPGVVFCHGANADMAEVATSVPQVALIDTLAREFTVVAADHGGNTFGNATGRTRIGQAIAYLRSEWGVQGPVALVGASMGGCLSLAYANEHPEDVACVAAVIPAMDLADIRDNNRWGIGPDVDACFPPAYDDLVDGPTSSPVRFATTMDPDLPVHLYTSNNDTLCLPSTAAAFQALRPQTGWTQLGNYSHGAPAITPALGDIVTFLRENT